MKLFNKKMLATSISLLLMLFITGQALADQIAGKVSRTTAKVVFLDDASQTALHVTASTEIQGADSVAGLAGKNVTVTFHKEGNRNVADSIVVKS